MRRSLLDVGWGLHLPAGIRKNVYDGVASGSCCFGKVAVLGSPRPMASLAPSHWLGFYSRAWFPLVEQGASVQLESCWLPARCVRHGWLWDLEPCWWLWLTGVLAGQSAHLTLLPWIWLCCTWLCSSTPVLPAIVWVLLLKRKIIWNCQMMREMSFVWSAEEQLGHWASSAVKSTCPFTCHGSLRPEFGHRTQSKVKTCPQNLLSDLHMWAMACAHPHTLLPP